MKISEAIDAAVKAVPNTIDRREFIGWLNRLDWQIKTEVLDNYTDDIEYNGYDDTTSGDTKLLVDTPYDELYIRYLEAQIHRFYEEINKYNNAITEFNAIYTKYKAQYSRTHTNKGAKRFKFYGGM